MSNNSKMRVCSGQNLFSGYCPENGFAYYQVYANPDGTFTVRLTYPLGKGYPMYYMFHPDGKCSSLSKGEDGREWYSENAFYVPESLKEFLSNLNLQN